MLLPEAILDKIFLMEEVINFPTSLLSHKNYHWENLPMVPYSNLTGAVCSLAEKVGVKILNLSEKEITLISFPLEHSAQDHTSRMNNIENPSSAA